MRLLCSRALAALLVAAGFFVTPVRSETASKTPVVFDTDIGDDIDDTWALLLLLRCPELDVRLIVTDFGRGDYRTKLTAHFLELAGRTDIPIGVGHGSREGVAGQNSFVEDFDLQAYPGTVHQDGAQALIDTINASAEPVTIIAVGPSPNLAEALRREPGIARKARLVGMFGSLRVGYGGSPTPVAEHNVKASVDAFQRIVAAPWDRITITPLDTCGLVDLKGERFARLRAAGDPLLDALMAHYERWADDTEWFVKPGAGVTAQSSTLFDTVAVYLAIEEDLCRMEQTPIRVTDAGETVIDEGGAPVRAATAWVDLEAFKDWLTERLLGEAS